MVSANLISLVNLCLMCWCIYAQPLRKPPELDRKMIKLLNACFADRLNPVVTTPDLHDSFLQVSWQTLKPPMILIDKNFVIRDARQHYPRFATFVFAPYSVESYKAMLTKARCSPWWHKDALFFIIGNLKDGCESAEKILECNWKMNSSSTLLLCHEGGRHAMLYTFNPYRNQAPVPWNETDGSKKLNNHWTMYEQKYHEGRKNCASLMFNKVTYMSKQQSDSSSRSESAQTKNRKSNLNKMVDENLISTSEHILQNLLFEIDFSAILEHDHCCYPHDEEEIRFIKKLIDKSYDMFLKIYDIVRNSISAGSVGEDCSTFLKHPGNICFISLILSGLATVIHKNFKSKPNPLESSPYFLCVGWGRVREISVKYFLFGFIQSIFVLSIISQQYSFITQITNTGPYHARILQKNNSDDIVWGIGYNSGRVATMSRTCKQVLWQSLIAKCKEPLIELDSDARLLHWCNEYASLKRQIDRLELLPREPKYSDGSYSNQNKHYSKYRWTDRTYVQYRPIQLGDLTFAFIVLQDGMFISTLVFMLEICWQLATKIKIRIDDVNDCPNGAIHRIT